MFSHCVNTDVITKQSELLKRCIEEEKWFLSEKAGFDVGFEAAEKSFILKYFKGFAATWRVIYCGLVCPLRHECIIGNKYCEKNNDKQGNDIRNKTSGNFIQ
jgi:hypothetical protein